MHTLKNWQHQTLTRAYLPHMLSQALYQQHLSRIYPRTRHYFPSMVGNFSISTIDLPTCGVYTCIKLLKSIDLPMHNYAHYQCSISHSNAWHTAPSRTIYLPPTIILHESLLSWPIQKNWYSPTLASITLPYPCIHFPKDNKSSDTVYQPYLRLRYTQCRNCRKWGGGWLSNGIIRGPYFQAHNWVL